MKVDPEYIQTLILSVEDVNITSYELIGYTTQREYVQAKEEGLHSACFIETPSSYQSDLPNGEEDY